jgi:hypothetical protein
MARPQITLSTFLLLAAALPIWILLAVAVPASTGWGGNPLRFVAAPLVLCGVTVAIHRLVRNCPNPWSISALLAGVIIWGALLAVFWISN